MTDETKRLDEIKPQEEFFLTDGANVMAIVGIPSNELGEKIISKRMGEFRKIKKDLLKLNFLGEDKIIFPSGTTISNELFEKARKTAKAWGCETIGDAIEFYECWENEQFRKDYPVMIVIDATMCFLIAPRVENEK